MEFADRAMAKADWDSQDLSWEEVIHALCICVWESGPSG